MKPGNFTAKASEVENAPLWAHLLSWFLAGHSRASPKPRQGIAPSFFCRNWNKGKRKRMASGTSEKLAQEGLRGNRDRLAVDACVLHARQVGSRGPRDRRPLRRSVRMYDNSMHRNRPAFQKRIVLSWRRERYCFTNRWREL